MSTNREKLATELAAGHPDTGAYDADSVLAAAELNAVNRPAPNVTIEEIMKFMILDNTHLTDGDDTQARPLWVRMLEVVELPVATPIVAIANPWGSTEIGNITEIQYVKTRALKEYFSLFAQGGLNVDLSDSNFKVYLTGAKAAGVMSDAQQTALENLGNNRQSRAQEIGHPFVKPGNVTEARA